MEQPIRLTSKLLPLLSILAVFLGACSSTPENPQDYGYTPEPDSLATEESEVVEPETTTVAVAQPEPTFVRIRADTPDSYTVKRGDTLWDIATMFLQDPWLWPEIWYFNPQIDNPHLIYPGDVIVLLYIDGKPSLRFARDADSSVITKIGPDTPRISTGTKTIKLSPRMRSQSLDKAIPTLLVSAIEPFLVKPRIITKEELENAPYVVGSRDNHLVTAVGNTIYVRELEPNSRVRYNVFRPGRTFKHPITDEILGYEAIEVSEAKLQEFGDPSTLLITRSKRETLNGDRILPIERDIFNYNFIPSAPDVDIVGKIIAFIDAISHTAQNQVVIIDLGKRDGLEVGDVLAIYQTGSVVRDNFSGLIGDKIKLPNTRAGLLMIFKAFDRISYALIMESTRSIHLNDTITNPTAVTDVLAQ